AALLYTVLQDSDHSSNYLPSTIIDCSRAITKLLPICANKL
ncbi:11820_t:CDS:1, partial [Funneliformis geosporum]